MASGSSSLDNLTNLYKHVIDDVIRNMREDYLNESVDTELLEELKQLWLSKLSLSGAVARPAKPDPPPPPPSKTPQKSKEPATYKHSLASTSHQATPPVLPPPPPLTPAVSIAESVIHHAPSRAMPTSMQATPTPASANAPALVLHPGMASSGHTPSTAGASPVGQATPISTASNKPSNEAAALANASGITQAVNPFPAAMNLGIPPQMAAQGMVPIQTQQGTMLVPFQTFMALTQLKQQQHQQQATPTDSTQQVTPTTSADNEVVQLDGPAPFVGVVKEGGATCDGQSETVKSKSMVHLIAKPKSGSRNWFRNGNEIVQLDGSSAGQVDSSTDDDSDEDSSEEEAPPQEGVEGSPLNSDDDLAEGDEEEGEGQDFETKDNIVCQWEKVYRVKNKWKFLLKDGIMHVGGHDYVFHKIAGEADW